MEMEGALAEVPGANEVVRWFGYWPSFHDAEVISLTLNREGESCLKVHTFKMTGELDSQRHYVLIKHVVVSFFFKGLTGLALDGFNNQNVIACLTLQKTGDIYALCLGGCYGVEGHLDAVQIRIEILPGLPGGSIYSDQT